MLNSCDSCEAFSAAKAALDMQMSVSQSVPLSVLLSGRLIFLSDLRFTSNFNNSKSYRNET